MADTATLVYDIDSRAARTAASDLAKLNDASARAAGGADKLNKSLRDSQGRFRSSYDVAKQYGSEIRGLAAKYNPALNAVYQYQQAQLELNRAVALGVLTQGQADAALERTAAQMRAVATGTRQVGNAQASAGNQFAQLNDVVVTAWGGMNPALIGMQQGMQMVQGFAGQSLPQALGTLKGAFGQLLNPMTLMTVGAVAAGAAIIQFGASLFSSSSDAKTFKDAVDSAESAIDSINKSSVALSKDGLDGLIKKYGAINAEVRELVRIDQLLAKADGAKALNEALSLLTEDLGDGLFNTAYGELERVFRATSNEAQALYLTISNIGSLGTIEQQLGYITRLRDQLAGVTDNFQNMSPEQAEMLRKLAEAEKLIRQLKAASDGLPASFSAAAAAAAKITGELERAVNAAYRLANSAISDVRFAQIELDFRTDNVGKAGAMAAAAFDAEISSGKYSGADSWLIESMRSQAIEGAKETARIMGEVDRLNEADRESERKNGGGGGGVGSASELQTFISTLKTRDQVQLEWYEKHRSMILAADALEFSEIGGKNAALQALEYQHQDKMFQIRESYRELERSAQRSMYGELAGLFGAFAGESKIAAIAQLGINTALRVAEIQQNTAAASMRAMAELGPIAGPPAAAKIMAMGKAQMALAVAAAASSGLGGRSGGSGRSGASSATQAATATPTQYVTIDVTGDSWARGLVEGVIEQIQQQTKDGRVVFMGNR